MPNVIPFMSAVNAQFVNQQMFASVNDAMNSFAVFGPDFS
ncbi:hypothetical protein PCCS19_18300 [Paenibacillus sp. CCS19]|nr:hypothetical protein PCCS19_18300 [Paenibacillus cellulosilyticus]